MNHKTPAQTTKTNPYAALEKQLQWGPTHPEASRELAHIIPPHHLTPALWDTLLDAYNTVETLRQGANSGFHDLGDGHYAASDPEADIQDAENALENLMTLTITGATAHPLAA